MIEAIKDRARSVFGRTAAADERDLARLREEYEERGFALLPGLADSETCDRIVAEAEAFFAAEGTAPESVARVMNIHNASRTAKRVLTRRDVINNLSALLGAKAVLLQSIYFHTGSQQAAHSDYHYMSTEPELQLCGFWLALEDVRPGAGELVYYPGSHRLPAEGIPGFYAENADEVRAQIEAGGEELERRYARSMELNKQSLPMQLLYERWTERFKRALEANGYERETFLARKGDALVWHANLAHGGAQVEDQGATRRSLVAHYLTERLEKYFDMNYMDTQHHMTLDSIDRDRPAELFRTG